MAAFSKGRSDYHYLGEAHDTRTFDVRSLDSSDRRGVSLEEPSYTVTDLGSIFPMSVKGDGAVIGSAVISGTQTPVVWVGGQV